MGYINDGDQDKGPEMGTWPLGQLDMFCTGKQNSEWGYLKGSDPLGVK